jgi:two-component system, NtrC family, sensor kinase
MRINLKTKIWFTVLSIVLMFSFFSLHYFPAQQEKIMKNNFDNEAQNLANTIALGVKIVFTLENFEAMKTAMSFVKDDPRLIFVNVKETDTIWNNDHLKYTLQDTLFATFPENPNPGVALSAHSKKDTIIRVSGFATKTMNGVIELCFSTDSIIKGKKQIRTTSLIVSGIVFIIGIIIGFWLSRNITVPVLALRNAANKVGEGDLTQRVKIRSGDEIGELAKAFNKMVEDLARAREELKKANLDLASANEALHATLDELKSAQDQLIQAEKMASLGQLTAGIAHEINNPINFVSANIRPLMDDMADVLQIISLYEKVINEKGIQEEFSEVEKFKKEEKIDLTMKEINSLLKGIEEGAERTFEIIKGLRNFSRLDQNVFRKADLNENLESTLTLLHSSYKNRIEIVKQFGDIPEIDCFPGQINQVFMNVLSNAIQAITGEGTIFIKTWQVRDMVKISVRDSGSGMSEEVRKKIFDPFFTTKDVGKGTGLGLSISYGIVQKHNGEIEVFSKQGKGTEFIICIPINQPSIT